MKRWVLIFLATAILAGCATTSSLQERSPSYVVTYAAIEHTELRDCVHEKIINKRGYSGVLNTGKTESHSFIVQPLMGFIGPQGTVWVANFYAQRTKIFGTASLYGDQGKYILPFIDECLGNVARS